MADNSLSEQAGALIASVGEMRKDVNRLSASNVVLAKRARRNVVLIRALAISVIFDVMLSVGLGLVALNAHDASVRASNATSVASQTKQSQLAVCTAGNSARAGQVELWDYVLTLLNLGNANQTPAQKAYLTAFQNYVDRLFAARDCEHLGATSPSPTPPPIPTVRR